MSTLSTSNAFAALDNTKKKKKSSKPKEEAGEKKKKQTPKEPHVSADLEKAVFSQAKLNVSNWADTDEDEDDFGDSAGQLQDPWLQVCAFHRPPSTAFERVRHPYIPAVTTWLNHVPRRTFPAGTVTHHRPHAT